MLPLLLLLQTAPAAPTIPTTIARPTARPDIEHTPRDWAATLRTDAQALHDDIAANHPGPVNKADPGFAKRNDAQLALALLRARTARTYGDYFFALRGYVASFDDGHLGFGAFGATPGDATQWPGFLTSYDASGAQRVVDRTDDVPVPLGAVLLGCDSYSAEQIAERVLAPQWGRWRLESQRQYFGAGLFGSEGNPYVPRPAQCDFKTDSGKRSISLTWRPVDHGVLIDKERAATRATSYLFASRATANGTRWYAMPSFNGDPGSTAGQALPLLIAVMAADRQALAAAPAIVLDVRGNGGGSSDWSRQIAEIIWGRKALRALPDDHSYIEWRASLANLASLEDSYKQRRGKGMSAEGERWFAKVIAGLRGATAHGEALWREPDDDSASKPTAPEAAMSPTKPPVGPVYVVTDRSCGSACLDAVDLWHALGAIVVGRTTSADTLYMDVRDYKLPSGIAGGGMPMKVYRGRARGSNEPVVPQYRFDGDITDTLALERWIAALPHV